MEGLSGSARGWAAPTAGFIGVAEDEFEFNPATPGAHRFGNILQRLRTHIVKDDINLPADLTLRVIRDADAAGLRDPLQSCGNVDAVAKDIVLVDDDVADMNTDAELDSEVLHHVRAMHRHAALDLHRTSYGVDSASELDQHTIACRFNYTSTMRGDGGVDKGPSYGLEPG